MPQRPENPARRKRINLTVRGDIIRQAKELNLNASQAAEEGILKAIKKAQEEAWLKENANAIAIYNKRIEENPPILKPGWFKGEW